MCEGAMLINGLCSDYAIKHHGIGTRNECGVYKQLLLSDKNRCSVSFIGLMPVNRQLFSSFQN